MRDVRALRDPEVAKRYVQRYDELRADMGNSNDVNVCTERLHCAVRTAAEEILPILDMRPHAKYITQQTVELIEKRAEVMNQLPRTEWGRGRLNYLAREIRRRLQAERDRFVEQMCGELEGAAHVNNLKLVFQVMNRLAGTFKPSSDSAITSDKWVEHFRTLFTTLAVETEDGLFQKLSGVADPVLAERLRALIPDGPPTLEELRLELRKLSKGKASKDDYYGRGIISGGRGGVSERYTQNMRARLRGG